LRLDNSQKLSKVLERKKKAASLTLYGGTALEVLGVKRGKPSSHALGVRLNWYSLHKDEGGKNSEYKCEFHGVGRDDSRRDEQSRLTWGPSENLGIQQRKASNALILSFPNTATNILTPLRPPLTNYVKTLGPLQIYKKLFIGAHHG
jgi:hypothetical protein